MFIKTSSEHKCLAASGELAGENLALDARSLTAESKAWCVLLLVHDLSYYINESSSLGQTRVELTLKFYIATLKRAAA